MMEFIYKKINTILEITLYGFKIGYKTFNYLEQTRLLRPILPWEATIPRICYQLKIL